MPYESSPTWQQRLKEARSDSTEALGWLLEVCRPDLLAMAAADEGRLLRTKVDAEDLVQQSFLEAHRDWPQFHGETPEELRAWLRQILRRNLADLSRRFHNGKHDIRREIPLTEANSPEIPAASPTEGQGTSDDVKLGGGGKLELSSGSWRACRKTTGG